MSRRKRGGKQGKDFKVPLSMQFNSKTLEFHVLLNFKKFTTEKLFVTHWPI